MKHSIFEILRKLQFDPRLRRKVMIFAGTGAVGLVITGGLAIWAGISAVTYVASTATQAIQSPAAQSQLELLKSEMKALPRIQAASCWGKVQSLLTVQPWLERPALVNLANLKVACFQQKPESCQGWDCEQAQDSINTANGGRI